MSGPGLRTRRRAARRSAAGTVLYSPDFAGIPRGLGSHEIFHHAA